MKTLDISVERTGFPVKLGDNEFFFDCSSERIERVRAEYQVLEKKLNSASNEDDNDIEKIKEVLSETYNLLLGEGTFELLYEGTPDVIAWYNAFMDLSVGVWQNVELFEKEQKKKSESVKQKYLEKQAKKKKR